MPQLNLAAYGAVRPLRAAPQRWSYAPWKGVKRRSSRPGSARPVVHGVISGPKFWEEAVRGRQSLFQLANEVAGAAAYAFNYRDAGLSWVTDDRIGPALAGTINCLAKESGRQVVVVAHSMSGLATACPRPGTRTRTGTGRASFACGDQVRLSLATENPNAAAVSQDAPALVEGPNGRVYYEESRITFAPGPGRFEWIIYLPTDSCRLVHLHRRPLPRGRPGRLGRSEPVHRDVRILA